MEKKKELSKLIEDYKNDVNFDNQTGTLTINGKKHIPYNKQIWYPKDDK
jgi:hypothetical protein